MLLLDLLTDVMLSELAHNDRFDSGNLSNLMVTDVNRVISQINRGLWEIYKRFQLKRIQYELVIEKGKREYELPSDVIELVQIKDKEGNIYALNRSDIHQGFVLNNLKVLTVPSSVKEGDTFYLDLQLTHPKVGLIQNSIDELYGVELELSPVYREALIMFVMSRYTSPIGAMAIGQRMYNESLSYYQQFEQICMQLLALGVNVQEHSNNTLFNRKGFV